MYTRCPDCGTIFRVTADVLRAARGAARCGICSASFDALEALRDEPHALVETVAPEDTITVEELPGNETIELSSTDAEASGPATAGADLVEPAGGATPTGDADEAATATVEEALEFRGTAEDAERIFVFGAAPVGEPALPRWHPPVGSGAEDDLHTAMERASRADLSGIEVHEEAAADQDDAAPLDDPDRTDEFPILVLDSPVAEAQAHAEPGAAPPEDARGPLSPAAPPERVEDASTASSDEEPRFLIPEALRRDLAASASAGDADRDLAARELAGLTGAETEDRSPRRWLWAAAALLLLAALGAQAVHFRRDDLARHPVAGPWIIRAYHALGLPLEMPADLAAFDLRQWGATSDPTQPGRLRLRASIVNRAVFAQPYPVLRLSLQDRFGNVVGVRDVEPTDYLPGGAAPGKRLLGAGQRADAEIVFVDPGPDAVGFELDLCLPVGGGLRCANPATP